MGKREIKFRAWDKEAKEYCGDVLFSTNNTRLIFPCNEDVSSSLIRDVKNYIIEQYTGLKDKNGVEIYEGDIVGQVKRIKNFSNPKKPIIIEGEYDHIYPIAWNNETCRFENISKEWANEKLEIIGNIHKEII